MPERPQAAAACIIRDNSVCVASLLTPAVVVDSYVSRFGVAISYVPNGTSLHFGAIAQKKSRPAGRDFHIMCAYLSFELEAGVEAVVAREEGGEGREALDVGD